MKALVREPSFPSSSRGLATRCPHCHGDLRLRDLKDGDQAHWCEPCARGYRIGCLPAAALYSAQGH
ncbi:uncharacterized protein (DUF983 family) [Deinobacterium chartae]|uniref:Uncharacterized protein (DUF983 family) n=1 Tax=Deinobacterium chartae TaxID=521158 RepID=A0A841I6S4_9DEIO|nr:hypothetical protein [Deinobacterium chartae]MBB6100110.1 uncharacterized protein (DUF983 family) [Deinobacterium chartae]